jgi:hypothetical protein
VSDEKELCEECGYELNTFACKIRHQQINVAGLKRARESDGGNNFGLAEQR